MGVVVGTIEDGMLGRFRAGVLLEATPGTDGFKVGAGYTVGSAQAIGLGLSATYLKSYGHLTVVPPGEDLLGLELNGDFFIGHWILGVMGSLESGTWYANAGAGVRFY